MTIPDKIRYQQIISLPLEIAAPAPEERFARVSLRRFLPLEVKCQGQSSARYIRQAYRISVWCMILQGSTEAVQWL